jgi:hypothetical protein
VKPATRSPSDVLAGKDGELADAAKITVSAEIIAQAKSEKVVVFEAPPPQLSPQERSPPAAYPAAHRVRGLIRDPE